MDVKSNAVLLMLYKTKHSQVKPKTKPSLGGTTQKTEAVRVALADAGRDDWQRFKRECVLLKGAKR